MAESRVEFRKVALEHIQQARAAGEDTVTISLAETRDVDASGLGILVLIQRHTRELGLTLRLVDVPSQVRYLLVLTKLDHLFEFGG